MTPLCSRNWKVAEKLRKLLCAVLAASLVANPTVAAMAGEAITRSDYEACHAQNEQAFRSAIENITIKALQGSLASFDYVAAVNDHWRRENINKTLDQRVDQATGEVRDETSWGKLLQSLAYQKQAQELATSVAERVYRSDEMKAALERLIVGVGKDIGKRLEFASQDAASPALQCLKSFLGPRYGSTVARAVTSDAGKEFGLEPVRGGAEVGSGTVLRESSGGLTGAAILLVRRQLANIARSIGQRLVGSVLSRLVSVVAGGIGIALIAKDLWDLRHGVLPIIATEMKAETTKQKVREELAKGIEEQISSHVTQIGTQSADHIISIWHQFRSAHAKALEIADNDAAFRTFLDSVGGDRLGRLDEVVSLVLAKEGEDGITRRLKNGTLNEAVTTLPAPALDIARETRSLETALKWNAVAGDDITKVADLGIYQRSAPDGFTRKSLRQVLDLQNPNAITRMAGLSSEARQTLLGLEPSSLRNLAGSLTSKQLSELAHYVTSLRAAPRKQLLEELAVSPSKMQLLASENVRNGVLNSSDQSAAVNMMLRSDSTFNWKVALENGQLAWNGQISPILVVYKHPIALVVLTLSLIFLGLILRRIFARRTTPPTSPGKNSGGSAPETA